MDELLQSGDLNKLMPYLIGGAIFQLALWLLLAHVIYSTVKLIRKENQCILPYQIWFMALPFFNIYWNFVVVKRVSDSLNNEFYDRKIEADEDPTKKQGYIYASTFLVSNIVILPVFIRYLSSVINFVYLFIYWAKMRECKMALKKHIDQNPDFEIVE